MGRVPGTGRDVCRASDGKWMPSPSVFVEGGLLGSAGGVVALVEEFASERGELPASCNIPAWRNVSMRPTVGPDVQENGSPAGPAAGHAG